MKIKIVKNLKEPQEKKVMKKSSFKKLELEPGRTKSNQKTLNLFSLVLKSVSQEERKRRTEINNYSNYKFHCDATYRAWTLCYVLCHSRQKLIRIEQQPSFQEQLHFSFIS